MKRSAAVIGTKKKKLPILVTELVHQKGLDMWLGAGVSVALCDELNQILPPSLQ